MCKKLMSVAVAVFLAVSASPRAQGMGEILSSVGEDAMQGYFGPFVTVFGTGMNSGWYNSSKPYSLLNKLPVGFSLTVSEPLIMISDEMREFDFSGDIPLEPLFGGAMSFDSISTMLTTIKTNPLLAPVVANIETQNDPNGVPYELDSAGLDKTMAFTANGVPTIFGEDTAKTFPIDSFFQGSKTLYTLRMYNAIVKQAAGVPGSGFSTSDTFPIPVDIELPFVGLGLQDMPILPTVPNATVQIGISKIPVIDNITLGIRFLPPIALGDFGSIGQFGFRLQYEFLHFVPVVGELDWLNASVSWGMNNLNLEAGADSIGTVEISQKNWIGMIGASLDKNLGPIGVGLFLGVGVESSKLNIDVGLPPEFSMPDLSLELTGDNKFRFQIGPRITLAVLEIWGDVNVGSVTSFSAGVGFPVLNGHGL